MLLRLQSFRFLLLALLGLLVLGTTVSEAADLLVPKSYPNIQAAVIAAVDGDRILVKKGIYKGTGNVNIDLRGKAITIEGEGYLNTVIDCEAKSRGFIFHSGEDSRTQIRGLAVIRGFGDFGGAVVSMASSPSILFCSFEDNAAKFGGAVACSGGKPGLANCRFWRNRAEVAGGAVYSEGSELLLDTCTFEDNATRGQGGAVAAANAPLTIQSSVFRCNGSDKSGGAVSIFSARASFYNDVFSANNSRLEGSAVLLAAGSSANVVHCSLSSNLSQNSGGGAIHAGQGSTALVENSILWSDGPREAAGEVKFRFSCVSGGAPGPGNTPDDPLIADAHKHDLRLVVGSPCIDRGDRSVKGPARDQDGRDRCIGSAPDMGAYEYPITRPLPAIFNSAVNMFTVPHDGNPATNSVEATIRAKGYDWLNSIVSYLWTLDGRMLGATEKLDLPLTAGEYQFRLDVRNSSGDAKTVNVPVKVFPEPNGKPVAYAGPDQRLLCTGNTVKVTLHGSATDPDGDTVRCSWDDPARTPSKDCVVDLAPGHHQFTFTVTDPYGAKGESTVNIFIEDGLGPKITVNGANPSYLEVFEPWVDPGATAVDANDGSLAVETSGFVNNLKLGTYTVFYRAKDNSGNESTETRKVIVQDTTPPVITLKGDNPMEVSCARGYSEPGATAVDRYDGPLPVTISGAVTSAPGTYTITYTANDLSGNIATATRTVIVKDVDGPVIHLNGANPMNIECSQGYAEPGATATDNCMSTPIPVDISGQVLAKPGTYTVTYKATGVAGKVAIVTRTVVVSDSKAPVITLKGTNPMKVECGEGYVEPGATAEDACDSSTIPVKITGSVSSTPGTYTVTYKAVDSAGNEAIVTRTVEVEDTKGPVITLIGSSPMEVECGQGYVEPGATALDGCDGVAIPVVVTGTVPSVKGSYTVTYTATDSHGNQATLTRTVKVVDTTAPVITLNGSDSLTVDCAKGFVDPGATAIDTCDGSIPVVVTGSALGTNGVYTLTYTATDASGNKATKTRTVTVKDTVAPVIALNGSDPMNVECGSGYIEPGATATDSCDGPVKVIITGTVSSAKGTYTITYSASDSNGNMSMKTRTVRVVDTTAPMIILNGTDSMSVNCSSGYIEPGASAVDSCEGSLPVSITGSVAGGKGSYTITYRATDSSGNSSTKTRTVTVLDSTAPVITLAGSSSMYVECGSGYIEPGASAVDDCDGSVTVQITGTVLSVKGNYTLTYTATDKSGNTATKTRSVTVRDTLAPVITLGGYNPMQVDCKKSYIEPGASALDACDGPVAVQITGSVDATIAGTYNVTYRATDASGNTATVVRQVEVQSKTPPSCNNFDATPNSVLTPDGKMTAINLHYGFAQHCTSFQWNVVCTSSDADSGLFAGDKPNDIKKIDNNNFSVRAECVAGKTRTYTFTLTAWDSAGNTASWTTTVTVSGK